MCTQLSKVQKTKGKQTSDTSLNGRKDNRKENSGDLSSKGGTSGPKKILSHGIIGINHNATAVRRVVESAC
jgi:hypothetical protein